MAVSPSLDLALGPLKAELARLQARITQLERNQRTSQLGFATVENGSVTYTDASGNPQLVSGLQSDGTYAHASVTSNAPPIAPDQPLTGPGVLSLWVYWDGAMSDGSLPLTDFDHIEVHCSAIAGFTPSVATLQGTMIKPGLFGVGNLIAGTLYYVCFVAVNAAGNTSTPGAVASATPQNVPANIPPNSVGALQLQTGSITAAQLAAQAGILGSQIANKTITGDNISANTISANLLTAGIIVAGVVDGTVINSAVFNGGVFNGTNWTENSSGSFLYSGTPALGNLIESIAPTGGTDGVGNAYLAGEVSYSGSGVVQINAGQIIMGTSVSQINTGQPASISAYIGYLQLGSGGAGGADDPITLNLLSKTNSGLTYPALQVVDSSAAGTALMLTNGTISPGNVAGVSVYWADGNSRPAVTTALGAILRLVASTGTSASGNTNNTTSLNALTPNYSIVANDAVNGSAYRLKCGGHGTQGSTQQALTCQFTTFGIAWGNTTTAAADIAASVGFHWEAEGTLIIGGVGVSVAAVFFGHFTWSQATAGLSGHSQAMDKQVASGVDTTAAGNSMSFQAGWGSITGAPTIVCTSSTFERLGA